MALIGFFYFFCCIAVHLSQKGSFSASDLWGIAVNHAQYGIYSLKDAWEVISHPEQKMNLTVNDLWGYAMVTLSFVLSSLLTLFFMTYSFALLTLFIGKKHGTMISGSISSATILIGTIPIFFTARVISLKYPVFVGAMAALIFGSFLFFLLYNYFYSELKYEGEKGYIIASMAFGVFPVKSYVRRSLQLFLDQARSSFLTLLGLSMFVEYHFEKMNSQFRGLTFGLYDCLVGLGDQWMSAWQIIFVIVLIVFIMDLILTLMKVIWDQSQIYED